MKTSNRDSTFCQVTSPLSGNSTAESMVRAWCPPGQTSPKSSSLQMKLWCQKSAIWSSFGEAVRSISFDHFRSTWTRQPGQFLFYILQVLDGKGKISAFQIQWQMHYWTFLFLKMCWDASRYLAVSTSQHLNVSMSQYLNKYISQRPNISTSRYVNISIFQCLNITLSQFLEIPISLYLSKPMSLYLFISLSLLFVSWMGSLPGINRF